MTKLRFSKRVDFSRGQHILKKAFWDAGSTSSESALVKLDMVAKLADKPPPSQLHH